MNPWDQFTGANAGYVYELFERYQRDPSSVDEATRRAFATWTPRTATPAHPTHPMRPMPMLQAGIAAFNLAESIRRFGHLAARLDPLGFHDPIGDPSLQPQSHGLTTDALKRLPASIVSGPAAAGRGQRVRRHRQAARHLLLDHRPRLQPRVRARRAGVAAPGRRSRASSARPTIRSTAANCSTASPRSKPSSASCIARSPGRRDSRSKAST